MPPKKALPVLRSGIGSEGFVQDPFEMFTPDQLAVFLAVLSTLMFSVACTAKRFADIMGAEEVDPSHMKLAGVHVVFGSLGLGRFYAAILHALMHETPVIDELKACAEPHPPPPVLNTLGTICHFMTTMVNSHLEDSEGLSRRQATLAALGEMNEFSLKCAMCTNIPEQLFNGAACVAAEDEEEEKDTEEDMGDGAGESEEEEGSEEEEYHLSLLMETALQMQVIKDYIEGISAAELQEDLKRAVSAKAVAVPKNRVEKLLFAGL